MKVIIEGEKRHIDAIIKENRIRVSRGNVKFSPADSFPTPEGVTEEDVKAMAKTIEDRDARIAELEADNETLKAALEAKSNAKDAPENPDTEGDGDSKGAEDTDTTEPPADGDTKDAPESDTKQVEGEADTKGKKSSKK